MDSADDAPTVSDSEPSVSAAHSIATDRAARVPVPAAPRKQKLWIWGLWLALFYGVWLTIVVAGNHFQTLREHWEIAVAMAFGSYVAGSTPMGGGTVGFPILVLLFDQPANLGRDFSFAVQSIGMTSASLFILARRLEVAWPLLGGAMAASLIGTPLGLSFVAPHSSDLAIKLVFAVLWASFGVQHLIKTHEFCGYEGIRRDSPRHQFATGALAGLLASSTVSAISGVGIDMVIYAVLVLMYRCDLKVAIPTSVIVMAFTSVVGIAFQTATGSVTPGVFGHWLAAAPIVALGAPLGVFAVGLLGREVTLVVVSVLCLGQFAWTCQNEWERLGWSGFALSCGAVLLAVAALQALYTFGRRWGHPVVK